MTDDDGTQRSAPDPRAFVQSIKDAIDKGDQTTARRVDELEARLQEVEAKVERLDTAVAPTEPE